jgi:hypothetical protein
MNFSILKRMSMEMRTGDLFATPDSERPLPRIIAHVVNDQGRWGKGFTAPLSLRYPVAQSTYLRWAGSGRLELGKSIIVPVTAGIHVAHLCAQAGLFHATANPVPFRLEALAECLPNLRNFAVALDAPIWLPKIGAGLGRGDFLKIRELLEHHLSGLTVVVFDLG